jgi:hypothetical protein
MTTLKEAGLATIDTKLEVIVIPVSDVARAEQFYRIVQLEVQIRNTVLTDRCHLQ